MTTTQTDALAADQSEEAPETFTVKVGTDHWEVTIEEAVGWMQSANGTLLIAGADGEQLAEFAPGRWQSVFRVKS